MFQFLYFPWSLAVILLSTIYLTLIAYNTVKYEVHIKSEVSSRAPKALKLIVPFITRNVDFFYSLSLVLEIYSYQIKFVIEHTCHSLF